MYFCCDVSYTFHPRENDTVTITLMSLVRAGHDTVVGVIAFFEDTTVY